MSATGETLASRGTIVVAEDDEATRMLLTAVLVRATFTVHACENGKRAYDAVLQFKPDVVLMDWMMPEMDGPTAVALLKANVETRGIPIVMLTTQSQIEERVLALEAGVQDFLTKPFDARELLARIDQQMRWRKMLAVDANERFAGQRLHLYRRYESQPEGTGESGFFDRIWGDSSKPANKRHTR